MWWVPNSNLQTVRIWEAHGCVELLKNLCSLVMSHQAKKNSSTCCWLQSLHCEHDVTQPGVGLGGWVVDSTAVPSGAWHRGCVRHRRRRRCRRRRTARSAAGSGCRGPSSQRRPLRWYCCSERPSGLLLSSCASGPQGVPYTSRGEMDKRER